MVLVSEIYQILLCFPGMTPLPDIRPTRLLVLMLREYLLFFHIRVSMTVVGAVQPKVMSRAKTTLHMAFCNI